MSVYCRGKGLMSTFLLSYFPTFSIYHLPVAASRQTGATSRGKRATSCGISGTSREIRATYRGIGGTYCGKGGTYREIPGSL